MAELKCSCSKGDKCECFVFRKVVIPAVMGDDSEDSPYAPENGLFKNALVEYEANGAMYIYSGDGIFTKLAMVTSEHGAATQSYVDGSVSSALAAAKQFAQDKDAFVLAEAISTAEAYADQKDVDTLTAAKAYTDAHSGEGGVSQDYVDQKDSETLSSAYSYTDTVKSSLQQSIATTNSNLSNLETTVQSEISSLTAEVPVFTMSNVDIGEGVDLEANHFYGVYE